MNDDRPSFYLKYLHICWFSLPLFISSLSHFRLTGCHFRPTTHFRRPTSHFRRPRATSVLFTVQSILGKVQLPFLGVHHKSATITRPLENARIFPNFEFFDLCVLWGCAFYTGEAVGPESRPGVSALNVHHQTLSTTTTTTTNIQPTPVRSNWLIFIEFLTFSCHFCWRGGVWLFWCNCVLLAGRDQLSVDIETFIHAVHADTHTDSFLQRNNIVITVVFFLVFCCHMFCQIWQMAWD